MNAPCVRVPRDEGERVRNQLAEDDLIDRDLEIAVEDGWLYIPVVDAATVPEDYDVGRYDVVTHDVEPRETQSMPADLVAFEPSYERIGDVAVIDEDDPERAEALANAIMESDLPVGTVLNKRSEVKGEERVRDWEVLAGDGTRTVHREYGCEYELDLAQVYFSPRLATERHRVAEQVREGERAFDMFAGVGPFVVPFARRGADCVGVDVNEAAIEFLRRNARRNGVEDRITPIHGDVRDVAPGFTSWADRIVMNLPHSADGFLDVAVRIAGEECVVHYYDIQPDDDPFGPGEAAIREAAEPSYRVAIEMRQIVRSYAPGQVNVCIDARLTRDGSDRNP